MAKVDVGTDKIRTKNFWRAVFAEFFGTMLFLLCVITVVISFGKDTKAVSNHVGASIGIGLAITTLVIAVGHVSGGHLNPAVSFAMVTTQRITILQGLFYILAQIVGGIVGAALIYACTPKGFRSTLGVTTLDSEMTLAQGFGIELMFTFILVFLIFSITDSKKNVEPCMIALGIGVTVTVCHLCAIPYTGCNINPARSFGPAVVMNLWEDHWVYWVAPLLGGVLAGLVYDIIFHTNNYEKKEKSPEEHELTKPTNDMEA